MRGAENSVRRRRSPPQASSESSRKMIVSEATFVLTDVETTGTSPTSNRVIEIGAVKLRDGEVVDRFDQLVNPQRSIPNRITQITGITTGMVFDAPSIQDVLPDYLDFLGDAIFTAHNATFDSGFINAELERANHETLSNETLCTLRLARRLLPGLDSKGLSRLTSFYDIDVPDRHRALGDAEATSVVLRRLLRQLDFEHEIETVEEVLGFQYRQYQKVREAPGHLERIRNEDLPDVPEKPGVYALLNRAGTILYVGKAKSLADRLRDHFTAVEARRGRKRKMLQNVRGVDWTETTTELQARLLESHLIKSKQPRFNRAQRRYFRRPFIRLDVPADYPTISWTRSLTEDGAEYYGPVRSGDQAETVVEVASRFFRLRECSDERLHLGQRCLYADMDRCTAPCETEDREGYEKEVQRVRRFLTGRDTNVLDELRDRMEQASDQHEFEKAAQFRDAVELIERLIGRQQILRGPVRRRNAVVMKRDDDEGTLVELYFIRFGQLVDAVRCRMPVDEDDWKRILRLCATHFDPTQDPPTSVSKRTVNEIRLLSHWVYSNREELNTVRWTGSEAAEKMASDVCGHLGSGQQRVFPELNR